MQKRTRETKTSTDKHQIEVTRIRLTSKCKREFKTLAKNLRSMAKLADNKIIRKEITEKARSISDAIWSIENGRWFIPTKTYEYVDIVKDLEKHLPKFFNLPKELKIEIGDLSTGILSFEKGYPKGVR